jgi:hypothetical protein
LKRLSTNNKTGILIICLATAFMIFFYGKIDYSKAKYAGADLFDYREMANLPLNAYGSLHQPFAFRILGPIIVSILPFSTDLAFYLSSIALSILLIIAFYFFILNMGLSKLAAIIAMLLFICNKYFFGFTLWNYFQVNDIISNIVVIILFWSMYKYNWILFSIALIVGVLARETPLVMIPTAIVYLLENRKWKRSWWVFTLAIVPALICFIFLRLTIHPVEGIGLWEALKTNIIKIALPMVWVKLLINSFIPLSLIPLIMYRETYSFFAKQLHLLGYFIIIVFTTMFGTDIERLMAPSFMVFYWLMACIIEKHFRNTLSISLLLAMAFLASFHYSIGRFTVPEGISHYILPTISLIIVALFAFGKRIHNQAKKMLWV